MATQLQAPPVHLCGRRLSNARHTCVFFRSRDEEYDIMAPFVKEGLDQGERVVQIVDGALLDDHDDRLRRAGIETGSAREKDHLSVISSQDAYISEGRFDQDRVLGTLESLLKDRRDRGYPQLRVTGNMEWALGGEPGTETLLEYETKVNLVSERTPDPFVCFYDVTRFSAHVLLDIMRTHPAVVIGGVFHENPFFVPPQDMLKELQDRRKSSR